MGGIKRGAWGGGGGDVGERRMGGRKGGMCGRKIFGSVVFINN